MNANPSVRLRLSSDPRIVMTFEDGEAVGRGEDYTPTDLALIRAGTHPYFAVATS